MLNKKIWVFLFQKYGKFWSILLKHFSKHKPLFYEELAVAVYAKMYHEMINEFQYGFGKCLYELYITYISKVDCNTFASIKKLLEKITERKLILLGENFQSENT